MKKYILILSIVFLVQIFISEILSIRGIRPDFLMIFILYFSVNFGSFRGVLLGFCVGVFAGLFDSGESIGILTLVYSIVGYVGGFLEKQHYKMVPLYFNLSCVLIILGSFAIFSYLNYGYLFYNDFKIFLWTWMKLSFYTISIITILQLIIPLRNS